MDQPQPDSLTRQLSLNLKMPLALLIHKAACAAIVENVGTDLPPTWPTPSIEDEVKKFSREENPHHCWCKHERAGTGVFYGSVKLIQCISCGGWQSMHSPSV